MATTIDRAGIVFTNDTGTPASPAGDGTLINAAWLTSLLDEIDQLFNGTTSNPFVFGARLQVDGFGSHLFSAGGTGTQLLTVRNTTAGTTNGAEIAVGNDGSSSAGRLLHTSSTYTPSAPFIADSFNVFGTRAGGLSIGTTGAQNVRVYTNSTERAVFDSSGRFAMGVASPAAGALTLGVGAVASASSLGAHGSNHLVLGGGGSSPQAGMISWGDGSGWNLDFGTRSGGNFTVRTRMTDGGQVLFSDGSVSAPALSFVGDTDTGVYRTSGVLNFGTDGAQSVTMAATSASNALSAVGGAYGTGSLRYGAIITAGRNSSGSGAPGLYRCIDRGGSNRYLWCRDNGDWQTSTTAPDESTGDNTGTVVGAQTSTRATKTAIRAFDGFSDALALIQRTPLYRFRYRASDEAEHVGIMADESPEFTRYNRTAFDPINAFGYTAAAIKALLSRVETLEAALAARG